MNEYRTKDFYVSCVLFSIGVPLIRLDRAGYREVYFIFDDTNNQVESIIESYWNKQLQIDAKTLIDSIRDMKARLFSK